MVPIPDYSFLATNQSLNEFLARNLLDTDIGSLAPVCTNAEQTHVNHAHLAAFWHFCLAQLEGVFTSRSASGVAACYGVCHHAFFKGLEHDRPQPTKILLITWLVTTAKITKEVK